MSLSKRTKVVALSVVVILLAVSVSGAAMMSNQSGKKKVQSPSDLLFKHDMVAPPSTGWISSPDASAAGNTTAKLDIDINGTSLSSVTVDITIRDDDGNHSDSDEGSDPDTVSVTIGTDCFTMQTDKASGEAHAQKEYRKGTENMFNGTINVTIDGVEFGGGNHPYGPLKHIKNPLLEYIDQGCEYTIKIEYTYWDQTPSES